MAALQLWLKLALKMVLPPFSGGGAAALGEELVFVLVAMASKGRLQSRQIFGRKKTAKAVAHCRRGNWLIKMNGRPLDMIEMRTMTYKVLEPVLLLGDERFAGVDSGPCEGWWS